MVRCRRAWLTRGECMARIIECTGECVHRVVPQAGRWPSRLMVQHSAWHEVMWDCMGECTAVSQGAGYRCRHQMYRQWSKRDQVKMSMLVALHPSLPPSSSVVCVQGGQGFVLTHGGCGLGQRRKLCVCVCVTERATMQHACARVITVDVLATHLGSALAYRPIEDTRRGSCAVHGARAGPRLQHAPAFWFLLDNSKLRFPSLGATT
jgi:hypothetical protein